MEDRFRTILVDNNNYKMEVELLVGCPFIHCKPHNTKVSTFKSIRNSVDQLRHELSKRDYPTLFSAFPLTDKVGIKYSKHFGMEEEKEVNGWMLLGLNTDMEVA